METTQAQAGKKIKLEIFADDAANMREQGQAFGNALLGKTVKPQSQVRFGDMLLDVKATKPKGPVLVGKNTTIKMSVTNQKPSLTCSSCGQVHQGSEDSCESCGADLDVLSL